MNNARMKSEKYKAHLLTPLWRGRVLTFAMSDKI